MYGVVFISIKTMFKWKYFSNLTDGLRLNKRRFPFIYYFHFFSIWLLLPFLIFLTPYSNSKSLWIGISLVQTAYLFIHVIPFFKDIDTYIIGIIKEAQILFVAVYLTSLQYADQSTEELKLKYLWPFSIVYSLFTALILIVALIFSSIKLIIFLKQKCKKSQVVPIEEVTQVTQN